MTDTSYVVYVANPTSADITTDSLTAKAGKVTKLTVDYTTGPADLYYLVSHGCVAAPAAYTSVTDVLDNLTTLLEKGSRMLYGAVRANVSAGTDAFAGAGL